MSSYTAIPEDESCTSHPAGATSSGSARLRAPHTTWRLPHPCRLENRRYDPTPADTKVV